MRALRPVLVAVAFSSLGPPALAEDPAGNAVAVIQQASVDRDGGSSVIAAGDGIFMGQTLITGNAGQVQVLFSDQTRLVVGPHSSLLVSNYLMRGDTASRVVVDALGGTFRFITGNSPKNAYKIVTPTGTLGVRGTAFDFDVAPATGETHVLLYHGGVEMCGLAGACRVLSHVCDVGVIPRQDHAALVGNGDDRKPAILQRFPYMGSQVKLREDFRVPGTDVCQDTTTVADVRPPQGGTVVPGGPGQPLPPPLSPPDDPPPSPPPVGGGGGHDNKGIGNGGDTPSEGGSESGNPHAGGNGHAHGHAGQ